MKMWLIRYEQASKEYVKACQGPKLTRRHNMNFWKKRLQWLDKELAKNGELYLEKTKEAS